MATPDKNQVTPPRNYTSRPDQYRLMVYVGVLMLIVVMMNEAGKAKNWEWMWKVQKTPLADNSPTVEPSIDTRLTTPNQFSTSSGPLDSFVARNVPTADVTNLTDEEVNQSLLSIIQDDTIFRTEEHVAWFHLFEILKNQTDEQIKDRSIGPVGYNQLFQQTTEYRGKVVEIRGTVRRAHRLTAVKNDIELAGYWQLFVNPNDGSKSPIVIYTLSMPNRFPEGMDLHEDASFVGFCYKRWAYQASDALRLAPVVLTKSGRWIPKKPTPKKEVQSNTIIKITLFALATGMIIAMGVYVSATWSSKRSRNADKQMVQQLEEKLRERRLPTVEDSLRELGSKSDNRHD